MSFLSLTFAVFFAAAMLLYYLLPHRFQWMVLLVGSVVFYLFSGPKYIFYVAATALTTYLAARISERMAKDFAARQPELKKTLPKEDYKREVARQDTRRRAVLVCALAVDLGILIVIKYLDFILGNVNALFGLTGDRAIPMFRFLMPLGLSYYTFSAVGYMVDVSRGSVPAEKNFARFALYLTYFPQILQGPIPRYGALAPQFAAEHRFDPAGVRSGLQLVLWGAFKKLVIADAVGSAVASTVNGWQEMSGLRIWLGMIVWGVQLYTDFSGGIDMSRGISECFGITLGINFKRPYFAVSLSDYWDRWHISLSDWLRDYFFYPMALSKRHSKFTKWVKKKWGKFAASTIPTGLLSLLLFTVVGLWHGANWGEVLFGVFNGIVIIISNLCEPLFAKLRGPLGMDRLFVWRIFRSLRTFWLITIARVLSRANNISDAFGMLGKMFFRPGFSDFFRWFGESAGTSRWIAFLPALCGCLLLAAVSLAEERGHSVRELLNSRPPVLRAALEIGCIVVIVIFGAYGLGYDASGFIYATKY